jgi:hypothetical protein
VINGNGRHAGPDVDSAPRRTGKMPANAAIRTIDETTARLDILLREKTRFGSALMRRGWNSTRLTSNPNALTGGELEASWSAVLLRRFHRLSDGKRATPPKKTRPAEKRQSIGAVQNLTET